MPRDMMALIAEGFNSSKNQCVTVLIWNLKAINRVLDRDNLILWNWKVILTHYKFS